MNLAIYIHRASLIAQSVKNLPAKQETQVQFLGREDSLEKEMATHSSIVAYCIGRGAWQAPVHGVARVENDLATKATPPPFSPKHPSHPGWHITLNRVPCSIQ